MNPLDLFDSWTMSQVVGWTLLHFLWQGSLIAILVAAGLFLLRGSSALHRYVVCCAGMILMLIAPIVTFWALVHGREGIPPEALSQIVPVDLKNLPIWHDLAPALPWITLFWLLGTCYFQGRLVLQWIATQVLRHRGTHPAPLNWRRTVRELCDQLGIRQPVRLLESYLVHVPMAMGWVSPVILVPVSVFTELTPEQLKAVIAHELAHIRRYDYLINLIQAVFEALFFYHPAVWWLSYRLRTEREYCCDDVAVSACRDALSYARALSSLDALRDGECRAAMVSTGGALMNRITRLVDVRMKQTRRLSGWLVPIVIALSLAGAVSAMTVSPATPDVDAAGPGVTEDRLQGDPPQDKPGKETKEGYRVDGPVCLEDLEVFIEKWKAMGKSHKEIQAAIDDYCKKAKAKEADLARKKELEKRDAKLVKKLQAEGKSSDEIKKVLASLHKQEKNSAWTKKKRAMRDAELIKKLKAKGSSKEEIKKVLAEYHAKDKQSDEENLKRAARDAELVKKLQAKGLSKQEIKKVLAEQYAKEKKPVKLKKKRAAGDAELIKKLKAKGLSPKEIEKALKEKQLKDKQLAETKKKQESDKKKEKF